LLNLHQSTELLWRDNSLLDQIDTKFKTHANARWLRSIY
jgi:hypothetical protein